jgi:hypothetical protein
MANGNKLYSAYRGAGKAAASYKASLYDVENLGIEREASQAMYQFETTQRDKTLALVQQGIGLASDIYGGYKAKKEATADRATIQEGMAKKAYGESEAEKLKKDKTYKSIGWDKLEDKSSYMSEFAPVESKRSLGEILTGGERKYTFGEGGDEFTSSQITAASSLYGDEKLSELLGMSTSSTDIKKIQEDFTETVDKKVESERKNYAPVLQDESGLDYSVVPGFENLGLTHDNSKSATTKAGGKSFDLNSIGDFELPSLLDNTKTVKYGGSWAKGGEFTTDGPELILVGDNPGGKEKVKVKPIKSKSNKTEGQESLSNNIGTSLKDLVSKKGSKPGSKKWMNEYISNQKINNESLRPLQGELSKHNKKLFSMAEESGYFGEFFRGGWE